MGLFDFIKGQFIEVIEWTDVRTDRIIYRFPVQGNEIKMGAKLTVRESQVAIFVNEGQIADVFEAGMYTLETENLPILTKLKSWPYGFNSPFKAEVYFVNTKQFLDQKWGTTNPIMMRDPDFGVIRLRGFGTFAYKVSDPVQFMKDVTGTNSFGDTEVITPQLKKQVISSLADLIGESQIPALDLAMNYDELGEGAKDKLKGKFDQYGLTITDLTIENLSLPQEVEAAMDKRSSMGALGDMNKYMQYQTAEAIRDAAQNEGGGFASMGAGMGAGMGVGQAMAGAMGQMNQQQGQQPQQGGGQAQPATMACPSCQAQIRVGAKFCPECGASTGPKMKPCVKCGEEIKESAKFCSHCGTAQNTEKHCSDCGATMKAGAKFCPECGAKAGE